MKDILLTHLIITLLFTTFSGRTYKHGFQSILFWILWPWILVGMGWMIVRDLIFRSDDEFKP